MSARRRSKDLSPVMKLLRGYLGTSLRGQTRLTFLLARGMNSLRFVPIRVADCEPFYVDLRRGHHDLIDSGAVPRPDFIKCDVEGAELTVFRGARKALDRADAPAILFEANVHNARGFGLRVEAAKNFLASLESPGFGFFEVEEGGGVVRVENPNPAHSNVLAVPRTKSDRLSNLQAGGAALTT